MILTDNETKVDLLNNEANAATIIKLLRDRPEAPDEAAPEAADGKPGIAMSASTAVLG